MPELRYHHIGIPTSVPRPDEEYSEKYKTYTSGYFQSPYGIEWMRFEPDCPFPELVKTVPHVAFIVDNLKATITDKEVLVGPVSPAGGVTTATIVHNGAPVEFIQFDRPESGIWPHSAKKEAMLELKYHHFGIPTDTPRPEDEYLAEYKTYASGYIQNPYGVEWMRFEPSFSLPELVKTVPHVAFVVDNLKKAIAGKVLLGEPDSPSKGVTVAMIVDNGAPVEFLQFDGPGFEVWPRNAKFRPE
ncbi:MAG: hypothetical protein JSW16_04885 [Dehalococcoidales bacterium]|nr:MAG: hypothetical protein JSW16_04885 [Dehalococcoidales bacterium]